MKFKQIKNHLQLFLVLVITLAGQGGVVAQTSELEIIGKRNQPFTITLGSEMLPGDPVTRTVLPLGTKPVTITITFRDTALGSITDTITPAIGSRLVYRVAETDVHQALMSSGFFAKLRALFSGEESPVPKSHQPSFSLKYLETLPIPEPIGTEGEIRETPQDTNTAPIRISAEYQFSRDSAQRIQRQDTPVVTTTKVIRTPGTDSTGAAAAVPQTTEVLTPQQLQSVISNLTSLKFEEDKVQYLQGALKDVSLTSEQLSGILRQFDFERSKLQVCKQYYHQLSDIENAESLYSVFDFDSTRQELKKWINDQSR
ncbi:MAG: DUF4476 domain-containing protein [Bacteroidales bacterium]